MGHQTKKWYWMYARYIHYIFYLMPTFSEPNHPCIEVFLHRIYELVSYMLYGKSVLLTCLGTENLYLLLHGHGVQISLQAITGRFGIALQG
jgi:hypothetical protein